MAPAEEARAHMAAAAQALKTSWTSLKFSPDHLCASMEYSQAATKFRSANMPQEAVDAWLKAAEAKEVLHDPFGAGRAYESAGAICEGNGPGGSDAAAQHWQKAITCFRLSGKGEIAAKLLLKLADLREKKGDIPGAKEAYEDAIEVFQQDEKDYSLGDVFKSYIAFLVRANQLEDALRALDRNVELLVRQKQFSFAHKDLLSKVVLHLNAGDTVRADEALRPTIEVEGWFMSKECQVGSDLVAAFQANDAAEVEKLLKEQVFTFLQVEVARIARKLRVASYAAPVVGARGGDIESRAPGPATVESIAASLC